MTEDIAATLQERLGPLTRLDSSFAERVNEPDATYVGPRVSAEIRYLERTSQGKLRHAAF
jgi:ATP-dependent DNA ligase